MKTQLALIFTTCFFVQSPLMAAGKQTSEDVQTIRFEDLKVACTNPAKFHNQVAPSNIQVSCTDMHTKWIPDQDGKLELPSKRMIMTSVISNKYSVSPHMAQVAAEPLTTGCGQYKQVLETVESVHATTCEEILAFQGKGEDYCALKLDALRGANPESIKVEETGKKVGFCHLKAQNEQE